MKPMFPVMSEEANPHRAFSKAEAVAVAAAISQTPRSGVAEAQYTGAWDCWVVEVRPRANRYGNPAVIRVDGVIARYH